MSDTFNKVNPEEIADVNETIKTFREDAKVGTVNVESPEYPDEDWADENHRLDRIRKSGSRHHVRFQT